MSTDLQSSPRLSLPLLKGARIASPCPTRWDSMSLTGDERTRHCDKCNLNVHNISAMTSEEAEAFLTKYATPNADGTMPRLCGHLHLRADGTVMTADCPVGVAALRAKARWAITRVAAAVGLTALVSWAAARAPQAPFATAQPLATVASWLKGVPTPPPMPSQMLVDGEVWLPPIAPTKTGAGQ